MLPALRLCDLVPSNEDVPRQKSGPAPASAAPPKRTRRRAAASAAAAADRPSPATIPNREERAVLAEARRAAVAVLADRLLAADLVDADFADLVADAGLGTGEGPNESDDDDDDDDDDDGDDVAPFLDGDALPPYGEGEGGVGEEKEDIDDGTPRLRVHVLLRHYAPPTREGLRRELASRQQSQSGSAKRRGSRVVSKSAAGTGKRRCCGKGVKEEGDEGEENEDPPTKKRRGRPRKVKDEWNEKSPEGDSGEDEKGESSPAPTAAKKRKEISAETLRNQLRRCDAHFEMMLGELRKFRHEHGHCDVPQGPENNRNRLGTWSNTIRTNYKMLRDDRERRRRLIEGGGMEEGAEGTIDAEAATTCGERGGGDEGETPKRRIKKSSLTAERIQLLNDLGFKFSMSGHQNCTWEERFEQLRAVKDELRLSESFQVEHVPYDEVEGLEPGSRPRHDLRSWLEKQSELHKRILNGKPVKNFVPDRLRQLAELGVAFPNASKNDVQWEQRFGDLLRYREEQGNCLVPKSYPGGLGEWVQSQRRKFAVASRASEQGGCDWGGIEGHESARSDLLLAATDERFARLREAGFVFSVKNRRWRKKPENFWEG